MHNGGHQTPRCVRDYGECMTLLLWVSESIRKSIPTEKFIFCLYLLLDPACLWLCQTKSCSRTSLILKSHCVVAGYFPNVITISTLIHPIFLDNHEPLFPWSNTIDSFQPSFNFPPFSSFNNSTLARLLLEPDLVGHNIKQTHDAFLKRACDLQTLWCFINK